MQVEVAKCIQPIELDEETADESAERGVLYTDRFRLMLAVGLCDKEAQQSEPFPPRNRSGTRGKCSSPKLTGDERFSDEVLPPFKDALDRRP